MYIDSSVLVKLVTPERDSEFFAERLEGRTGLVSSVIAFTEVWSALLQKEGEQAISGASRIAGWREFTSNLNSAVIELLSVDRLLLTRANRIMARLSPDCLVRTLDAVHLATCALAQAFPLQTTDGRMRRAASALKIPLGPEPSPEFQ